MQATTDGLLLIDKPKEWTSFDVVAKVRSLLKQAALVESFKVESKKSSESLDFDTFKLSTRLPKVKVGHTGTLDPLATGLLVLTVGSYCKRAQEFSKLDKVYEVSMELGKMSTTGDEEGEKTIISTQAPSDEHVRQAVEQFVGDIEQIPPAFSAIKVGGKRAYELARQGKTVEIEPRWVKIHSITNVIYDYPHIRFTTRVSSGTYIRTLVEDIGHVLRTGAYMSDLRRTSVGGFSIDQAITIEEMNKTENFEEKLKKQ